MNRLSEIKEKGMFYTRDSFSKLLVENISKRNPSRILELGVGNGSLIKYAIKKWKEARFTCTDINPDEFKLLSKTTKIEFIIESGLHTDLKTVLNKRKLKFDVAICNPPYLKGFVKDKEQYKELISLFVWLF